MQKDQLDALRRENDKRPAGKNAAGTVVAFLMWAVFVVGGTVAMIRYSSTPGRVAPAPSVWPTASQIPRDAGQPVLVMFIHPQCPCSRASIGELDLLAARCEGRFNANVVFVKPDGTTTNWEKTDLWRQAASIPGVNVLTDEGGVEARRFHAGTSGETLLYDTNGALRFQGGITVARGHSGDNAGRGALQDFLLDGHTDKTNAPVYGCSLFDKQCKPDNSHDNNNLSVH